MKPQHLLCLILILISGLTGCATDPSPGIEPRADVSVQLPVRFRTYQELYTFIAQREGVPADAVFKLAADSETEIDGFDDPLPYLWVITPHFYNGGIFDQIRGEQGNGRYYILRPLARDFSSLDTDRGFELVGLAEGNSVRWTSVNRTLQLITGWHISAGESPETVYQWNGKFFEQMK